MEDLIERFASNFTITEDHTTEAIVFACVDHRFNQIIQDFVRNELGHERYDLKIDAGSVKQADPKTRNYSVYSWIIQNFKICIEKHEAKKLLIFAHFDCGAYGGNASFTTFEAQLTHFETAVKAAAKSIRSDCPTLEISAYIMVLTEGTEGGILPVEL